EPSAVKVARWVLRGTALGNKCRLLDKNVSELKLMNPLALANPLMKIMGNIFSPESSALRALFYLLIK
ncbi:hypothetical protein P3608_22870, partial [Vibrio parahaemolyticus]|nr:hypothetical protein [Vibrio parahaemolyticus]MDF5098828.1 hypothetical protein [Vibrio parahaemolyticus]